GFIFGTSGAAGSATGAAPATGTALAAGGGVSGAVASAILCSSSKTKYHRRGAENAEKTRIKFLTQRAQRKTKRFAVFSVSSVFALCPEASGSVVSSCASPAPPQIRSRRKITPRALCLPTSADNRRCQRGANIHSTKLLADAVSSPVYPYHQ